MHPEDKVWRALVHKAMPVNCVSQSGTQCEQMSISTHSLFLLSSVFCLISTFRLSFFLPYSHQLREAAEASQLEHEKDTSGTSIDWTV